MKFVTVCIFAILVLFGIVSCADMPQVVYIHYSTPEEAEEAQKKILAEYEGATIVIGDDPTLSVANVTSTMSEKLETPSEKLDSKEAPAADSSTSTEAAKDTK